MASVSQPAVAARIRFSSDNNATACPEILEAIGLANQGLAAAYGDDPWTARLDRAFGEFFGTPVRAFGVITGTAANALSLGTIAGPYETILAHAQSHVVCDEFGAPEMFSGGARVIPVEGEHGKLTVDAVAAALRANPPSMRPAALSLTEATDLGTLYRPAEIAALASLVHDRGMRVHMDGARFANALVALDCHPADLTWKAGVDVLSFGATKNGALAAEAVVFFGPTLVADFALRRRRGGHLLSKSRFLSAQLLGYLESGVWRRNAARANRLAREIARGLESAPLHPVEANEIFLHLEDESKRGLRGLGFEFDDWGPPAAREARFVVSWDQPEEDVAALVAALNSRPD